MFIYLIVALSLAFQLAAALMAFRLIRLTGDRLSWAAITVAMGLQMVRRVFVLMDLISGRILPSQVTAAEIVALASSILIAIGVATIGSFFGAIKKSIAESKKIEEKYSTLVEKSNDGIVIIQDGRLRFSNNIMLKMTGFPPDEVIGRSFIDFVSPHNQAKVADYYRRRVLGEHMPEK